LLFIAITGKIPNGALVLSPPLNIVIALENLTFKIGRSKIRIDKNGTIKQN
jgi:hypothetical protein